MVNGVVRASLALAVAAALSTTTAAGARAEEEHAADGTVMGVGVRVGGYGFRDIEYDSAADWRDCRMDGAGVFHVANLTPHWFTEASVDVYVANGRVVAEEGMDRLSLHALGAMGFRAFPQSVVSAVFQLGGGVEYTEVEWATRGESAQGLYPLGFVGAGGEINAGDHVRMGMNLRLFVMAGFEPEEQVLAVYEDGTADVGTTTEAGAEAAGQLQFFLRYDL
jgi:hypothetical protein